MRRNETKTKAPNAADAELQPGFWREKSLAEMNAAEWEALCDGCGKCCLVLLQDDEEDGGAVWETDLHCQLFDPERRVCRDYENRHARVPDCVRLSPANAGALPWMPETCAYRLVSEGAPLPDWHPLVTGDRESTAKAGVAVRGDELFSESDFPEDGDWEERITQRRG